MLNGEIIRSDPVTIKVTNRLSTRQLEEIKGNVKLLYDLAGFPYLHVLRQSELRRAEDLAFALPENSGLRESIVDRIVLQRVGSFTKSEWESEIKARLDRKGTVSREVFAVILCRYLLDLRERERLPAVESAIELLDDRSHYRSEMQLRIVDSYKTLK